MRRKIEDIRKIIKSKGIEILEEYIDKFSLQRRMVIRDSNYYLYNLEVRSIIDKKIHPFDKSNPYTLENISTWIKNKNKPFLLTEENEYLSSKSFLKFHCFSCDETFQMNWNNIHSGQNCPFCLNKKIGERNNLKFLRPDLMNEWNYEKNKILPEEVSISSGKVVYWKCKKCDNTWDMEIYRKTAGEGCPFCSGRRVSDGNRLSIFYPDVAKQWHPFKNNGVTADDVSYGSHKSAWWLCDICGYEWKTKTISRRCKRGTGCPNCNMSKGERRIYDVFNSMGFLNGEDYVMEKTFSECRNEKELEFDFYLPKYRLIVEYQGIQHYEIVDIFGGEKDFKIRKKRDLIKRKFAQSNNYNLLIIPYWDFDNINKILTETLLS